MITKQIHHRHHHPHGHHQVCTALKNIATDLIPAIHLLIDSDGPSSEKRRGHALGQYRSFFFNINITSGDSPRSRSLIMEIFRLLGDKCNGRPVYKQLHTVELSHAFTYFHLLLSYIFAFFACGWIFMKYIDNFGDSPMQWTTKNTNARL